VARADLDKTPADVAAMFDDVAERYDLTNDVLAAGQTRRWRRAVVEAVNPQPGERILDLAAGTGTSSVPFAQAGAMVVPTDFSLGMLRVGKVRQPFLPFVAGDGQHLPFRDASFDAATISFGLRNLNDRLAGSWPGGTFTQPPVSVPVGRFGLGTGGNAHAPDEYFLIDSTNPRVAGLVDATMGYVEFLYTFAAIK